jgi:hypothetical protein
VTKHSAPSQAAMASDIITLNAGSSTHTFDAARSCSLRQRRFASGYRSKAAVTRQALAQRPLLGNFSDQFDRGRVETCLVLLLSQMLLRVFAGAR